jgi:hypothetical protein
MKAARRSGRKGKDEQTAVNGCDSAYTGGCWEGKMEILELRIHLPALTPFARPRRLVTCQFSAKRTFLGPVVEDQGGSLCPEHRVCSPNL